MASYAAYNPTSLVGRALFNFDEFGFSNFKYTGAVSVSVSDSLTWAQATSAGYSTSIYTSANTGNGNWTAAQLKNIDAITSVYSNFINLKFSPVVNYSGTHPVNVGSLSDINISLVVRADVEFSGISSINLDSTFGYAHARGDIVLNVDGFGSDGAHNDTSLDSYTFGFQVLMHEIGHSLGLSHPHSDYDNGVPTVTSDYATTVALGFDKLGFPALRPVDMYKSYFSIMSYDDQTATGAEDSYATTPMILDVMALQGAYGEGTGSSGAGNDLVAPGSNGAVGAYRTYFDVGGLDTIDLKNYADGAYLHMGTSITGASHDVGVSMSTADENTMTRLGGDPSSLRWFYGEFENALGSAGSDHIIGNALANAIDGKAGNDAIDGGAGTDLALYSANRAVCTLTKSASGWSLSSAVTGIDTLQNVERLQFTDKSVALDLDGAAGKAVKIIGAVFGPESVANRQFVGAALKVLDSGWSYEQLASAAVGLTGKSSAFEVVSMLWTNVVGTAPTAAQALPIVALLEQGMSVGQLTVLAADMPLNTANIDLVGLVQSGVEYFSQG